MERDDDGPDLVRATSRKLISRRMSVWFWAQRPRPVVFPSNGRTGSPLKTPPRVCRRTLAMQRNRLRKVNDRNSSFTSLFIGPREKPHGLKQHRGAVPRVSSPVRAEAPRQRGRVCMGPERPRRRRLTCSPSSPPEELQSGGFPAGACYSSPPPPPLTLPRLCSGVHGRASGASPVPRAP